MMMTIVLMLWNISYSQNTSIQDKWKGVLNSAMGQLEVIIEKARRHYLE